MKNILQPADGKTRSIFATTGRCHKKAHAMAGSRMGLLAFALTAAAGFPANAQAELNVGPLLTTQWNQGYPYNDDLAYRFGIDGIKPGTGALAIAQTMKHWQFPAKVSGLKLSLTNPKGAQINATHNITFNWAKMTPELSAYNVAELVDFAAFVCKSDFSKSPVGGSAVAAYTCLVNDMGFSAATLIEPRSAWGQDTWADLLIDELSEGRPVVCHTLANGAARFFIVDGARTSATATQWHIDMGGYTFEDDPAPLPDGWYASLPYEWTDDEWSDYSVALIGLRPGADNDARAPRELRLTKPLSVECTPQFVSVRSWFVGNSTDPDFWFDIVLRLEPTADVIAPDESTLPEAVTIEPIVALPWDLPFPQSFNAVNFDYNSFIDLPSGTWKASLLWRRAESPGNAPSSTPGRSDSQASSWQALNLGSAPGELSITIANGSVQGSVWTPIEGSGLPSVPGDPSYSAVPAPVIAPQPAAEAWFTLDGLLLPAAPSRPGIYLRRCGTDSRLVTL